MLNWCKDNPGSLWFFLPAAILTSLALTYAASMFALPSGVFPTAIAQTQGLPSAGDNIVVLPKGDAQTVGRVKMTYQGLKTGRIVINITPTHTEGYAYRRDIPINTAEKGFWLARQYFKLVSAGRSKLEIVRINI